MRGVEGHMVSGRMSLMFILRDGVLDDLKCMDMMEGEVALSFHPWIVWEIEEVLEDVEF